jgi:ribosomal protein L35
MKTNKSFTTRLRTTKNGKLVARKPGQNHFNAKAPRKSQLAKKRTSLFPITNKSRSRFISK